jgi:hypothetical protein
MGEMIKNYLSTDKKRKKENNEKSKKSKKESILISISNTAIYFN